MLKPALKSYIFKFFKQRHIFLLGSITVTPLKNLCFLFHVNFYLKSFDLDMFYSECFNTHGFVTEVFIIYTFIMILHIVLTVLDTKSNLKFTLEQFLVVLIDISSAVELNCIV